MRGETSERDMREDGERDTWEIITIYIYIYIYICSRRNLTRSFVELSSKL